MKRFRDLAVLLCVLVGLVVVSPILVSQEVKNTPVRGDIETRPITFSELYHDTEAVPGIESSVTVRQRDAWEAQFYANHRFVSDPQITAAAQLLVSGAIQLYPCRDEDANRNSVYLSSDHGERPCFKDNQGKVHEFLLKPE